MRRASPSLLALVLLAAAAPHAQVAAQSGRSAEIPAQTPDPIPVFDGALQAVNPAWFARAMEGVDFGIHGRGRYGELVADPDELLKRTLAEMDRSGIRRGMLIHGPHAARWRAAHPDRFLLSYVPDLSLTDHAAAAAELAEGVRSGKYVALGRGGRGRRSRFGRVRRVSPLPRGRPAGRRHLDAASRASRAGQWPDVNTCHCLAGGLLCSLDPPPRLLRWNSSRAARPAMTRRGPTRPLVSASGDGENAPGTRQEIAGHHGR